MDDTFAVLILLAVIAMLCGPAALIVALVALSRIKTLREEIEASQARMTPARQVKTATPTPPIVSSPGQKPSQTTSAQPPSDLPAEGLLQRIQNLQDRNAVDQTQSLEQQIGTRWVLIAGVVTVVFAVGFFLKYAYDNDWITPLGRVIIAAAAGLLALLIGEVTRRRDFGIAAKGVTALGFAILYATVFAANRWYGLLGSVAAFATAASITGAAMLYAVGFDEIVAAVLALIGGYFTPVVVSMGQNLPTPLFTYVLILSSGAMLCAYWHRWTAVNAVALVGAYFLYTGWFERFYRPAMQGTSPPDQLGVALFWLAVFFLVFLILPILHGLRRRVLSQLHDIVLVPINATIVLYYLWTMLDSRYRTSLALCSFVIGAIHLGTAALVRIRCKEDVSLRQLLIAIGLAGVTLAVPLYWKRYAISTALAVEAVILVVAGLRYRSPLAHIAAAMVLGLAIGWLTHLWPIHREPFRAVLNPAFRTWCFVAGATIACHFLYRFDDSWDLHFGQGPKISEVFYAVGLLLLMVAISSELWSFEHWYRQAAHDNFFTSQMTLVLPAFVLLFTIRPVCPRGTLCRIIGTLLAAAGSVHLLVTYPRLHEQGFSLCINADFIRALPQVAVLFGGSYLISRSEQEDQSRTWFPQAFRFAGIIVLWGLLTEEIWAFFSHGVRTTDWRWLAQMWISVMWAAYGSLLMGIGFWRQNRSLRYAALALFGLLLAKIFLWDTRTIQTVYRIAGFLATGLALIAISYLYQILKKKGFFTDRRTDVSG